jgi:heterodisulfide reductase subunit C
MFDHSLVKTYGSFKELSCCVVGCTQKVSKKTFQYRILFMKAQEEGWRQVFAQGYNLWRCPECQKKDQPIEK